MHTHTHTHAHTHTDTHIHTTARLRVFDLPQDIMTAPAPALDPPVSSKLKGTECLIIVTIKTLPALVFSTRDGP
jgi:hypothetical protein